MWLELIMSGDFPNCTCRHITAQCVFLEKIAAEMLGDIVLETVGAFDRTNTA